VKYAPWLLHCFTLSLLPRLEVTVVTSLLLSESGDLFGALKDVEVKPKLLLPCWGLNSFLLTPPLLPSLDLLVPVQSQRCGQRRICQKVNEVNWYLINLHKGPNAVNVERVL